MRVSLFLSTAHRVTADAERVVTIVEPGGGVHDDELNLYFGQRPAETAVIVDRLIEALQAIRNRALRAAVADGAVDFAAPRVVARTPVRFYVGDDDTKLYTGFATGEKWNGFDVILITIRLRDEWIREFGGQSARDLMAMPLTPDGFVDTTGWTTVIATADQIEAAGEDPGLRDLAVKYVLDEDGDVFPNPDEPGLRDLATVVPFKPASDGDHFAGRDS
jgi:hypothetical protein